MRLDGALEQRGAAAAARAARVAGDAARRPSRRSSTQVRARRRCRAARTHARASTASSSTTSRVGADEFARRRTRSCRRHCARPSTRPPRASRASTRRHERGLCASKPRRACVASASCAPIRRVGLYVPAGRAPLPSTALMLGVPARLAGCREVVLCTPPRARRQRRPGGAGRGARCAASTRVFKLGGAQAIAAMAFGTDIACRSCDKLFGPGNAYVTEAKRQVAMAGDGAGDRHAGRSVGSAGDRRRRRQSPPSSPPTCCRRPSTAPDSQVLLRQRQTTRCWTRSSAQLDAQLAALPRADIAAPALAASRADPRRHARRRRFDDQQRLRARAPDPGAARRARLAAAGAKRPVRCSSATGRREALGDYCSGTNHVLPTGGAARCVQRPERGQLPDRDQRAGGEPRRPRGDRPVRGRRWRAPKGWMRTRRAVRAAPGGGGGMSALLDLVRAGPARLRRLPLRAQRVAATGAIWLNANESPWPNRRRCASASCAAIRTRSRRRCASALAELYGVRARATAGRRGSDEAHRPAGARAVPCPARDAVRGHAADLRHVRGLRAPAGTRAGRSAAASTAPTGSRCDFDAVARCRDCAARAKLVFLCSPGNPTGAAAAAGRHRRAGATAARVARWWWSTRPTSNSPTRRRRVALLGAQPEHRGAAHAVEGACAGGGAHRHA